MIRAFRFLALFTALLVVSARCVSGFPLAVCVALPEPGATEICPPSDQPHEQDTLAAVALDDSDDDADPVVAPSAPRIRLLRDGALAATDCGALAAERALASHAPSLERPPRA
ncbi:MAG: hypothetical protein WDO74_37695 [Pseudomonadota bacterium]